MKFRYVKKETMNTLPKSPGIYAFKGKEEILYMGKAANIRNRVKNHFQQPSYRDHFFIDKVRTIGYRETGSEIEALLLESQLIKKHLPRYNIMWRDDKKYFYVAHTKEKLPRIFITHQPPKKSSSVGPFVDGKSIKRVLRLLRPIFPYYTARTHPKVLCAYCHLDLCPGPNPDPASYRKNVKRLVEVLRGKRRSVRQKLEKEMRMHSSKEQFEKAKAVRDKLFALDMVFAHADILRPNIHLKQEQNWQEAEQWLRHTLSFTKRILRIEAYDISNIQGKEATGSMVVFMQGEPAKQHYRKFKIRIAGKPDDFAMLRELISRRMKHKEWGLPQFMLIDGGKGQLSAAIGSLGNSFGNLVSKKETKFPFRVVALAKKNNELFLPDRKTPLLLKDMPPSVAHILLHIRDEAHRFAITYHRKLMRRRA